MTLRWYLVRRFVFATLAAFTAVLFLATLFDALELARDAADLDVSFWSLVGLAAMRAPTFSMKAAPYVVLLAAMWTYARLARSSELVVMRSAGLSAFGLAGPAVIGAVFLGVAATTIYNPIAAALLDRFERLSAQVLNQQSNLLAVSREGLWLRQGNADAQSVIHAKWSTPDGQVLAGVTILLFEEQDTFTGRIDAEGANLLPGFWRLTNATIREIDADRPNAPPTVRERPFFDLPTELTPEQIIDSFAPPETISFWRLPGFISTLEEQGFSARRHRLHFETALAAPVIFTAMALLGVAFSMRHARFGGLGMMALYAALTGFVVFFVLDIAQALGGSGLIPVSPAAWGPAVAALLFASGLLLHFEET